MTSPDRIKQRLAEIAHVLSMSTDALVAISTQEGKEASLAQEASEIAEHYRAIADPNARHLLLELSRSLAQQEQDTPKDMHRLR